MLRVCEATIVGTGEALEGLRAVTEVVDKKGREVMGREAVKAGVDGAILKCGGRE